MNEQADAERVGQADAQRLFQPVIELHQNAHHLGRIQIGQEFLQGLLAQLLHHQIAPALRRHGHAPIQHQLRQQLFARTVDQLLQRDKRDVHFRLFHADGRHDAIGPADLFQPFLQPRQADRKDLHRPPRMMQDILDQRFQLKRRALTGRADRNDRLGAAARRMFFLRGIDGFIPLKAAQRLINAVQIHAGDVHLAHRFQNQWRRYHVQRPDRNLQLFRQHGADVAERAHIRQDQHALPAAHGPQHRRGLVKDLLRPDLQRHIHGDDIRIHRAEQLLRHIDHGAGRAFPMRRHENGDLFI